MRDAFVQDAVRASQALSRYDASEVDARHGVVSLTADGLIRDVSLFSPPVVEPPLEPPVRGASPEVRTSAAPSFSEQLRQASQRVRPLAGGGSPTARAAATIHPT